MQDLTPGLGREGQFSDGANPPLREDGAFGPRTNDAVIRFRSSQGAVLPTGRATAPLWNDLGVRVEIEHPIIGMGQPTNMSCWSVAMTMMLGTMMSVGAGAATLGASGGLQTTPENVATFARQHGLLPETEKPFVGLVTITDAPGAGSNTIGASGVPELVTVTCPA